MRGGKFGFLGSFVAYAGSGPSAFPVLLDTTATAIGSSVSPRVIDLPATVANGDLLLMHITNANSRTFTTPAGWARLGAQGASSVATRSDWFYKIADGSEGGTTVAITASGSSRGAAYVHRIQVGTFNATTPLAILISSGDNVSAPVPSLSIGTAADALWLASAVLYFDGAASAYPYPDDNTFYGLGAVSGGISRAVWCSAKANSVSAPAGNFSITSSISPPPWISVVVAVLPP